VFFAVVTILLGPDGDRLPPRHRRTPIRGMVTIGEMNRHHDSEPYSVMVDLWEAYGTSSLRGLACMSSPLILPNGKAPGMMISGMQRETWRDEEGNLRIKEHRQVWQVLPTQRNGSE
jgi:hypothetical protein